MKKIICIFCNCEQEKAKEHIWPKWIQKDLIGNTKSNFNGSHISFSSFRVLSERLQTGESLVFGNVCKKCNNGWMSKIETEFKICFQKIKSNYSELQNLSKSERQITALWGLKTAMMINSGSNYRKIIPERHFIQIQKDRQIPKNVKIDLTFIKSDDRLKWEQSNFTTAIKIKSDKSPYDMFDLTKNSYVVTMQMAHLGIKIMYYNECKELGFKIPESREFKAIRIWPFSKNVKFNISNSYKDISEFHSDTILIQ